MDFIDIRHRLHEAPELSGQERQTAATISALLSEFAPDEIITGIGGHGIAVIFDSGMSGPTILFRAELDALPIYETGAPAYRSKTDGKAHLCGHDGHMTILLSLAQKLRRHALKKGRIVLLFQPAEETGAGARAVIADHKFQKLKPDFSFALHNLPGLALGTIGFKTGPFNFASEGLRIKLEGRTSHASHPEDAVSPANAISKLITDLPNLPATLGYSSDQTLITICHAQLGEPAFGITPGTAEIWATIRSVTDELQAKMLDAAIALSKETIIGTGLEISFTQNEKFAACTNDSQATNSIASAAQALGLKTTQYDKPFRWSEDFGLFGSVSKSALFVLGAGEDCPQLHAPDYDFPDELIEIGARIFDQIASQYCR